MAFFKPEDLSFFQNRLQTNNRYSKDQSDDIQVGKRIKEGIFTPSNEWAKRVVTHFPELKHQEDNAWNVSGYFKKYSWARLYIETEGDRGVYFTIGVDGQSASLFIKIDYRSSGDYLDEGQKKRIETYLIEHPAKLQIPAQELTKKNWDWLVAISRDFIKKHLAEFKQLNKMIGTATMKPNPLSHYMANEKSSIRQYPLNTIMYGPPGTGKTYGTIDLAVDIVKERKRLDDSTTRTKAEHHANSEEFKRFQKEGQIQFVTFHQNYTYEDFVIGLKPDVSEDTEHLSLTLALCCPS